MVSMAIALRTRILFFNDTATTEIYTLSLHDALPILEAAIFGLNEKSAFGFNLIYDGDRNSYILSLSPFCTPDRKSTRLNSSHANISYAVFCLKKKKRR